MSDKSNQSSKKTFMLDLGSTGNPFTAITVDPETEERTEEEEEETEEETEETSAQSQTETQTEEEEETEEEETEEETETTEEETEDETEEEDDINIYHDIASELKKDAFLPQDVEINEDIDGPGLKTVIKDKLKEDLQEEIRAEVHQNLINQGYSDQDLIIARAIRQGVDPRLLSTASMYETYSTMSDDVDDSTKKTVASQMYRTRGFKETEISNMLSLADDDEKLGVVYKEAKEFFQNKYKEFADSENERNEKLEQQAKDQAKAANNLIRKIIKEKKILDVSMGDAQAKEFQTAIKAQNQVLEVGGQKFRASELQKFLYEFQVSDELKLLAFYLTKFRGDHQDTVKKEVKKQVEDEFLAAYKQRTLRKKKTVKKKKEPQTPPRKTSGNTYVIDLSGGK